MATQTMSQAEITAFSKKIEDEKNAEGHVARWVYPSMAAAAWGVPEDVVDKLIVDSVVPVRVIENSNEPKVTYVDVACAPIKKEDALRWGRAEPEKITYKVSAPVHLAAAEVMKMPQWDELNKRYAAGERWTSRTQELLDVMGEHMEFVYEEKHYVLEPLDYLQGSLGREMFVNEIKQLLKAIGCQKIYFDYGRMD